MPNHKQQQQYAYGQVLLLCKVSQPILAVINLNKRQLQPKPLQPQQVTLQSLQSRHRPIPSSTLTGRRPKHTYAVSGSLGRDVK
ncbi:hypothetical protein E4U56_004389 [Claviceps arundinis]|uniref:Uncharacterized protein n=1 Tax=Claviceps arundinis TaxID=1623583 RepID=A0A9P7MNJ3_9HYPO|nr:hypothetical protein E4U56_004389 [Claviceps arundinis]